MRSYCSLYVDAGYLMAAASTRVTGTSLRSATDMDVPALLAALVKQVEAHSGLPLLRIHWYDAGTRQGVPGSNQREIASIPKVKLRLGRVGFNGEQKGVDLKLALDLITQSRNRVAEIVYLVSGDDDLSEAVEEAQHLGVQVVSLVVPDEEGQAISVSKHLQMTVDQMILVESAIVDDHVKRSVAAAMRDVAEATLSVVPDTPAVREPAGEVPAVPTPLSLARRAPAPPPRPRPVVVPAYSTSTGSASGHGAHVLDASVTTAIDDVVDKVVSNWWRGASPLSREQLDKGKPSIPQELDRTLLNDLSNRLSVWDIPTEWRFALRDAFWEKVSRL